MKAFVRLIHITLLLGCGHLFAATYEWCEYTKKMVQEGGCQKNTEQLFNNTNSPEWTVVGGLWYRGKVDIHSITKFGDQIRYLIKYPSNTQRTVFTDCKSRSRLEIVSPADQSKPLRPIYEGTDNALEIDLACSKKPIESTVAQTAREIKSSTIYVYCESRRIMILDFESCPSSIPAEVPMALARVDLPACQGTSAALWSNCFGTRRFGEGFTYTGEFLNGTYDGQGIYSFPDGRKYVGEFKGGKVTGQAILYLADGRAIPGIFKDFVLVTQQYVDPNSFTRIVNNSATVGVNDVQRLEPDRLKNDLEKDRQLLAEEKRRFDAEKAQREEEKKSSRIAIRGSASQPDTNGDFTITIQTGADTASLKIDGEELGGKRDGNYVIKRVARVGEQNTYTITARDVFGNNDTKTISVARQAVDSRPTFARLNPANIKPQPAHDAVAIIIGIQNYKLIPKAEYANQDAQDFYDYASRALGIKQENIKLLLDDEADVSGIFKAFQNWLPLKVRKGKTDVYVFYSGHGLPSTDGKSLYFLPVGADRDLIAKTAISQKEIVDALKSAQPKSVTMFIDSCYSGQIRTGETLLASARPVVMKVNEVAYPPEFTVITASASDQIASSSPDLKHGIFSYYLMKGLEGEADQNRDGTVTIGKLQGYLADRVPRFAMTMSRKQEPQMVGDANRVLVGR